jgi:hypothetical protein
LQYNVGKSESQADRPADAWLEGNDRDALRTWLRVRRCGLGGGSGFLPLADFMDVERLAHASER